MQRESLRRRYLLALSVGSVVAICLLVIYAHSWDENTLSGSTYRDSDAERSAAFANAGAAVVAVCYLLTLGLLVGPRPVKILSSNLLVLVFLLTVIEGATHLLGIHYPAVPRRGHGWERDLWVYDNTKGWFHVPNTTGEASITGPDRGAVRINSLGLRGKDVSRDKPAGVKRTLVFGDSFIFGVGVDEGNLFTSQLENFLNARDGSNPHQVINLGVSGYATDQEFILWEELGKTLSPDLVVLVVCDNDFSGNTEDFVYHRYYKPYFELDDGGELGRGNTPVPILSRTQRIKLFLVQESNSWNFVRSRKPESQALARLVDSFQVGVPRPSQIDPVDITAALVLAFADRADAAGARFLVTNTGHRREMVPLFHSLRPKLRKPGIYLLGLEETLQNARRDNPDKLWDFPHDIHWNRDAHGLAAEVIANYIMENSLLEEPRH